MAKNQSDSDQQNLYEYMPTVLPGKEFRFINHGYAKIKKGEDGLSWLKREDKKYLFNVQMLCQIVDGLIVEGKKVLEVGSGRGGNCWILAKYFKPRQIVGLDYSKAVIKFCKSTYKGPKLKFTHGSAMALPFKNKSFDAVINIESSHCYPSPTNFYKEVFRVLKPGGSFRYTDNMEANSIREITAVLKQIGFDVKGPIEITPNVALALNRGKLAFRKILAGAGRSLKGIEMAKIILDSYESYYYRRYKSKKMRYMMWHLKKPERR